jgi:hypothetical protein
VVVVVPAVAHLAVAPVAVVVLGVRKVLAAAAAAAVVELSGHRSTVCSQDSNNTVVQIGNISRTYMKGTTMGSLPEGSTLAVDAD